MYSICSGSNNPKYKELLTFALDLGLSNKEFERIVRILGRIPSIEEIGVYSAMWSEHCSYKSSKKHISTFPKKSNRLLVTPGSENAGVLSLDDNYAVVFKVESHNHPSAVEPFQGAATGVGGILRDIFAMGARPIALLDSLRFGNLSNIHNRHLFEGVVSGIAHYGNCIGVPVVGGDVEFDNSYTENPLVNVMAVGIIEKEKLTSSRTDKTGAVLIYYGARTGRDGINGASFASCDLDKESDNRSSIQIGDPFTGKLVLEATLEIAEQKLALSIQDMGAAGITSSASEITIDDRGVVLFLDKVPLRDADMSPFEILLSETQERMLAVVDISNIDAISKIFDKWDIQYSIIGNITDDSHFSCYFQDYKCVDLPISTLAGDDTPVYDLPYDPTPRKSNLKISHIYKQLGHVPISDQIDTFAKDLSFVSKSWICDQFDYQVGNNTVIKPGDNCAVMKIYDSDIFLSLTLQTSNRFNLSDSFYGAQISMLEGIHKIVSSGGWPIGITNCLNYGNPNNPDTYRTFVDGINGISKVCEKFDIPVTGGNVSFYNETSSGSIIPTPIIGIVGIIENVEHITSSHFGDLGNILISVNIISERCNGDDFSVDLDSELKLARCINKLIKKRIIKSCSSVSTETILSRIIKSIFSSKKKVGVELLLNNEVKKMQTLLNSHCTYLMTVDENSLSIVDECFNKEYINFSIIGRVVSDHVLRFKSEELNLDQYKKSYQNHLIDIMDKTEN